MPATPNLTRHEGTLRRGDRERLLEQSGCVIWLTGLSASGKSSIARAAEERLYELGNLAYVLDGDNLRHGLNSDLGFSNEDRAENIRRVGEVAALFVDAGLIVLTAFISPFRADRDRVRSICGDRFLEVFVDAPLAVCEARDPKGLYRKARSGAISEFTGLTSPYEPPAAPELHLDAANRSVDECARDILAMLRGRGFIARDGQSQ